MEYITIIIAFAALVLAIRNKRTVVVKRERVVTDTDSVRDIAQQAVDRHEQNYHRR